jgi:hypothetical protein
LGGRTQRLCRPFATSSHKAATGLPGAAVLAPRRQLAITNDVDHTLNVFIAYFD